jgi:hypothetical protein
MKIYIVFFFYITWFGGCSSLILKEEQQSKGKLSCEEKAKPKSLLYLEQQYRCTTQIEKK